MKKLAQLFILCTILFACGQEPAPPSQEWCEWAFWQIPDHKPLSQVDSTAFSADFFYLLKEVDRLSTWEYETFDFKPAGADCLSHWYDWMEGSRFDGGRATLSFTFTPTSHMAGEVSVTIDHPDFLNGDNTRVSHHEISVVYEDDAWRINDWDSHKWVEIKDVLDTYQQIHCDKISIDSRARAILNRYLESFPVPNN